MAVVPVACLQAVGHPFEGLLEDSFSLGDPEDVLTKFLEALKVNLFLMNRDLAEKDPVFKQPIIYTVLYDPVLKSVFVYTRSDNPNDYDEGRLFGTCSIGVGGHISPTDMASPDPLQASIRRELLEEVGIEAPNGANESIVKLIGLINDNSNDVGQVHFGILAVYNLRKQDVIKLSAELKHGRLVPLVELETYLADVNRKQESWTKLSLPWVVFHLQHPRDDEIDYFQI